jgi:hypothetical protein
MEKKMRNVITMLFLMFTTAVYADSVTIIQDMNGNYTLTAFTFGGAPATIYNPNPQQ